MEFTNDNGGASDLRSATADDVRRYFGDMDDPLIAEVLANAPTLRELDEVASWLARYGDAMALYGGTKTRGIAAVLEYVMGEGPPPSASRDR